jgi:hypothetical protein
MERKSKEVTGKHGVTTVEEIRMSPDEYRKITSCPHFKGFTPIAYPPFSEPNEASYFSLHQTLGARYRGSEVSFYTNLNKVAENCNIEITDVKDFTIK